MTASTEPPAEPHRLVGTQPAVVRPGLGRQLARLRTSRLVRQNAVQFLGGLVAGVGGFIYHAVAGRALGPRGYGEVASVVALFTVGQTASLILILVLARFTAHLRAEGRPGAIRYLVFHSARLLAVPAAAFCLLVALASAPAARFLNLDGRAPLLWIAVAVVAYWYLAIPRGVLQGTQRFPAFSANLGSELIVRTLSLGLLLAVGLAVTGAAVAIGIGALYAIALGLVSLRGFLRVQPERVRMRTLAGFALTATAGTVGVVLLYNQDVVLAKHYLDAHGAGIYGGLNKIGTIVYFLTLSVSQVLFPRVVEAVATRSHPGRLLLLSAGLIVLMGLAALLVFGVLPGLVVRVLFGPAFGDAVAYVLPVGVIGLALSLANLLVQFLMAVHDRAFVPILAGGCLLEAALIAGFHGDVGQVVADVLVSVVLLLLALAVRWLLLLPRLRPEMLAGEDTNPAALGAAGS